MKKEMRTNNNRIVATGLFGMCVLLVIMIYFVTNRDTPSDSSAVHYVSRSEVVVAFDFLNQDEAVLKAAEAMENTVTYAAYQQFLQTLNLWQASGMEQQLDWKRQKDAPLTLEDLMVTRNEIAALFENQSTVSQKEETEAKEEQPKEDSSKYTLDKIDEAAQVRVLLLQDGQSTAEDIYFSASAEYTLTWNGQEKTKQKKKVHHAKQLKLEIGQSAAVASSEGKVYLTEADGSRKSLDYNGSFEITRYQEGYAVVNVVPIEQYVYGVVQSEMPAYFEREALKAQAVCARTYIVNALLEEGCPDYHANVDDSVQFQAYNQVTPDARVIAAVDDTKGQIIVADQKPIHAYFFSTSFGMTSGTEIWKLPEKTYLQPVRGNPDQKLIDLSEEEKFRTYIREQVADDYDAESNIYRWRATIDVDAHPQEVMALLDQVSKEKPNCISFKDNSGNILTDETLKSDMGKVERLLVTERSASGAVLSLRIIFKKGTVDLQNENYIRQLMGLWLTSLQYKDGSSAPISELIPSVYFYVQPIQKGTVLFGGGLGHGIGLSQYGSDGMAKEGASMEEIIHTYFRDVELRQLYQNT